MWAVLALALGDAAVLAAGAPDPDVLAGDLAHPHAWLARAGADRAAATLAGTALWLLAAWVAVGLLACGVAAAPGALGRAGDRLAEALLPRALYRCVAGAAGLSVLVAPVAAGATPTATATASAPSNVSATVADLAPAWPSDAPLPAPAWPTASAAHPPPIDTGTHRAPARAALLADAVRVRPGDSLWSIAAEHLPADASAARVAHTWPRWYGANRAVIGGDPALLHPGQLLQAPATDGATP